VAQDGRLDTLTPMSDDWRLRIELADEDEAGELVERLSKFDLPHELQSSYHDRVVVSRDGAEVFCYADTREQAEAAERAIGALASERGWRVTPELRRWHPTAEKWEDPDAPLPHTGSEQATERAELMQAERDESVAQGFPDFEVRVKCGSRREAEELAERLRAEGLRCVQRWQFVVLGADDEDTAQALADRIRSEAPPDSTVTAEASLEEAVAAAPLATPFSPFAVFGGLGG
jgi:hypothetical protein